MARVNLRAAFMSGMGSTVAAQQVFTNRTDEVTAFGRSLENLHRILDEAAVSPVVDRAQGRHNLLTFYGVGGIGKTTLSFELERRLLAQAEADKRRDVISVRVDVSEDGASDIEGFLLRLRAGLGRLGSRWPAFDLALAAYWARAHPGEALQDFLDTVPAMRRASRRIGLSEQIAANVEQLAPEGVGGLTGLAQRAAIGTYRAIRNRVREGRLLSDCDLFAELIDADADYDTLSFFPYLLAWDLERRPRQNRRPTVCVFLDTFEVLAARADRAAERFLQRCVYLMPNVLFVITGRNRIDWADADPSGELDFRGPDCWPYLHFSNDTAEPRQHLVGYLSDSDADSYLREALTEGDVPVMPAAVRERIIAGGRGLPLYLDLSVSHFVELLARGRHPDVDDFGGSFTAVATRSIRDLPREERDLVRTTALVDRVDAALLRASQPTIPDGFVARFLRRPFLTHDDAYERPYALHVALSKAIGEGDAGLSDGWSDLDRREVAGRLLRHLGNLAPTAGRAVIAQALESGLKLSGTYGIFDDWITHVTQRLVDMGQWAVIGAGLVADVDGSAEYRAIRATIQGVQLRRTGRAAQAVEVLESADAGSSATGHAAQLVRLHLAHALRNHGDYIRAADIYRDLLDGPFDAGARYWLCDYDYLNGRFTTAVATLGSQRGGTAEAEGERLRLVGHILRVNARFAEAAESYVEAITLARGEGLVAAEAKALANLAQTTCWSGDMAEVAETADQARELLELVPNPVELVKVRSAEAIAAAIAGDTLTWRDALDDTRRLTDEIGYRGGHNLADVADIVASVLSGDLDRARQRRGELDERTRDSGGNTYWVPIVTCWLDGIETAAEHHPGVEWLDGPSACLRRWDDVVTHR